MDTSTVPSFVSTRTAGIAESIMLDLVDRARAIERAGVDVIRLERAELDLPTPAPIVAAAQAALSAGATTLTPARGTLELRRAIATALERDYGQPVDPESEVIVTAGAKFGVFIALAAVLDPGDEVLCLSPHFPPYREMARLLGARFVPVPLLHAGRQVELRPTLLAERITPNTRALLFNYPHNPTGWVPGPADWEVIADTVECHNLVVISDEVHEKLLYDGLVHHPVRSIRGLGERAIQVTAFSKTYSMAGWRVGYNVADPLLIAAMTKVQQNTITCASAISQHAGVAALLGPREGVLQLAREYQQRRDLLISELRKDPDLHPIVPQGGSFLFLDTSATGLSSLDFAMRLLEEEHVSVQPGAAFAPDTDGYLRVSLTAPPARLAQAAGSIRRIAERARSGAGKAISAPSGSD